MTCADRRFLAHEFALLRSCFEPFSISGRHAHRISCACGTAETGLRTSRKNARRRPRLQMTASSLAQPFHESIAFVQYGLVEHEAVQGAAG